MELFCKIYLNYQDSKKALEDLIQPFFPLDKDWDFSVSTNREFHATKIKDFPNGFLFFKYWVDIEPMESTMDKEKTCEYIDNISSLLKLFWVQNIPAVASCDFEAMLPENGGYKSKIIPFPN